MIGRCRCLAEVRPRRRGPATLGGPIFPTGAKRARWRLATTLGARAGIDAAGRNRRRAWGMRDVSHVTQLIKQVSANRTVLMVEHNMSVVSSIANTISVLQRGAGNRWPVPISEVSKNPQVCRSLHGDFEYELRGWRLDDARCAQDLQCRGMVRRIAHPARSRFDRAG